MDTSLTVGLRKPSKVLLYLVVGSAAAIVAMNIASYFLS